MNTQPTTYTRYEDVPVMRRSSTNEALMVLIPGGTWVVVYNVLTGPIYMNKPDGRGGLKTWGRANKYAAIFLLLAYTGLIIYLITLSI